MNLLLKWIFLKWNSQTWKCKFLRNLCSNGFIPDAMLMTVCKFTCPICFQVDFSNFIGQRVFNVFFLQFDFHGCIFLRYWTWNLMDLISVSECESLWNVSFFDEILSIFSDFSETANCQTLTTFPLKEVFTMKGVPNPIWIAIKLISEVFWFVSDLEIKTYKQQIRYNKQRFAAFGQKR